MLRDRCVCVCLCRWLWRGIGRGLSHLTDLCLAAASLGHLGLGLVTPPPRFISFFHPLFSLLPPLPPFPLCSSSASAQRRITKGVVSGRQTSKRAGQRVGWHGEFISGSLHFAWRSPERRRQSETSIQFFFFFVLSEGEEL